MAQLPQLKSGGIYSNCGVAGFGEERGHNPGPVVARFGHTDDQIYIENEMAIFDEVACFRGSDHEMIQGMTSAQWAWK